jgi:hypothetical protein
MRWELMKKSRQFWDEIVLSKSRGSAVLPGFLSLQRPKHTSSSGQSYWGTGFSSASGLAVFICGKPYPHWPTIDVPVNSEGCISPPYYDLSLQDMNWNIVRKSNSSVIKEGYSEDIDAPNSESIQLCDVLGWEGTGCLAFSHCVDDHHSSTVEIPLSQHVQLLECDTSTPTQTLLVKTTECRSHSDVALGMDIVCYLVPVQSTLGNRDLNEHTVQIIFSWQKSSSTDGISFQFNDVADGAIKSVTMTIQSNRLFLKTVGNAFELNGSIHVHDEQEEEDDGVSETRKYPKNILWEECSYILPCPGEFIPSIKRHYGFDSTVSFQLVVAKADICLSSQTPQAHLFLGTFSILHHDTLLCGDDVAECSRQVQVYVESIALSEVKRCSSTCRIGATIAWTSLSLSHSLVWSDSNLGPQEGVSIFTLTDHSIVAKYVEKIIELCDICVDQFHDKEATFFSISRCAVVSTVNGEPISLEKSLIPLGSTRTNRCRVNLLPAHRCFYYPPSGCHDTIASRSSSSGSCTGTSVESGQTEGGIVSQSRVKFEMYVLFLQPYSFAFTRPMLSDCPVALLCIPC